MATLTIQEEENNQKSLELLREDSYDDDEEQSWQEQHYCCPSRALQWCIAPLVFLGTMVPASALLAQVLQPQNRQALTMHHGITLIPTLSIGVDLMGIGVVLVSIVGLCGVAKGCRRLMNLYFGFVLCFVALQVVFVLSSFLSGDGWIQDALEKSWDKAYNTDKTLIRDLQNEFNCQGFHTPEDRGTPLPPGAEGSLPACRDILSVRFGKRLHRLGTLILCIRLIQLAGVFLLSILFKHLTVADDDDEQHNDEESSYFESEKEIEDMSARVPLLQAEEKCEDQDLQPRYVVFDEDSEDDGPDSYSELACQGITYQDMSDSADDDHESRINVA